MRSPSKNDAGYPSVEYRIEEDLEEWLAELSRLDDPVILHVVHGSDGMRWLTCDDRKELYIL